MTTRREVLESGLIAAAILGGGSATTAIAAPSRHPLGSFSDVDALLVSESIVLPAGLRLTATGSGRTLPVIPVGLTHAQYGDLRRVLARYDAVAGLSSGAELFCIERIGWNYGMRLMQLHSREASSGDPLGNARAAMQLLGRVESQVGPIARPANYRPSQADGLVHAWILQKPRSDSASRHAQQGAVR